MYLMLPHKKFSRSGFTIVELLIVIVVIAILASITIVAFNGIQQRARNSQIVQGVTMYEKAIRLYQAGTGTLPSVTGCLGANYPSDQCWTGINGNRTVNASLDTMLSAYISTKPTLSTRQLQITAAPDYRLGATYNYVSQADARIVYYLEGASQRCINGVVGTTEMQGTQCVIQLGL